MQPRYERVSLEDTGLFRIEAAFRYQYYKSEKIFYYSSYARSF